MSYPLSGEDHNKICSTEAIVISTNISGYVYNISIYVLNQFSQSNITVRAKSTSQKEKENNSNSNITNSAPKIMMLL
jgi:hypothetical protein